MEIVLVFDKENESNGAVNSIVFKELTVNDQNQILILVIDYMFYSIINSCKIDQTFEEYMPFNKIEISRIYKLPYFIATSNGHSKSLFSLFREFKIILGYIASINYNKLILENRLNFFDTDFSKNGYIKPIRLKKGKSTKDLSEQILNSELILNSNIYKFREISIYKDNGDKNELYKAIDKGVQVLNEVTNFNFFKMRNSDYLFFSSMDPNFAALYKHEGAEDKYLEYSPPEDRYSRLYRAN